MASAPTRSSAPTAHTFDNDGLKTLGHPEVDVFVRHTQYVDDARPDLHAHDKTQLGLCREKSLTFRAGARVWVVPPGTAFYAPAGVVHLIQSNHDFEVQSIFLSPDFPRIPSEAGTISTHPLMRELIGYLVGAADQDSPRRSVREAITLLCEHLRIDRSHAIRLPMPTDRRLLKIALALVDNPADRRSLEDWAESVGASARSLSRLFPEDTGMTFREWHQTLRLTAGIRRLTEGASVSAAAIDVGYENVGAFIDMFKRVTNTTPAHYMRTMYQ